MVAASLGQAEKKMSVHAPGTTRARLVSAIESSFGPPLEPRHLEGVFLTQSWARPGLNAPRGEATLEAVLAMTRLVHCWAVPSGEGTTWRECRTVATFVNQGADLDVQALAVPGGLRAAQAIGNACLIESSFRDRFGAPGNFEMLVQEEGNLVHYWRNNSDPDLPWYRGDVICGDILGFRSFLQSKSHKSLDGHGDFHVFVNQRSGTNDSTWVHYRRDNDAPGLPWIREEVLPDGHGLPTPFDQ
jgi:hypothetical protein